MESASVPRTRRWLPFRLPLVLCAIGAGAWAVAGVAYGLFAGARLIGEPNRFKQEVGHPQLYWAGAALLAAVVALLIVLVSKRPRFFVVAAVLVMGSIVLSLPGWSAHHAANHPDIAPELAAFRAPSEARLVQQDPGSRDVFGGVSGHLIWQTNREPASVCAEVENEFRQWALNVRRERVRPCFYGGDRGAFGTFVEVEPVESWHPLVGEQQLAPGAGTVAIRLAVIAS